MFKKFGATLSTVAIAIALGTVASPAALAVDQSPQPVPMAPTLTLSPATCDSPVNAITISGLTDTDPTGKSHRFILYTKEGDSFVAQKQLNAAERKKLYDGDLTAEGFNFPIPYGSEVGIAAYWRDWEKVHDPNLWTTVRIKLGSKGTPENVSRLIVHVPMKTMTLVDPATLNCAPAVPAPKTNADDIVVPTATLAAAKCEAGKPTDNVMTVDKAQKHPNYRFVATYDGKSLSLKTELRDKLWANGKLTAKDIQDAYPGFTFDYTKPLAVQAYWFDAENAYADTLYDKVLKLAAGKSDKFIKLGEAKTLTLVDPASLNCVKVKPSDPSQPGAQQPGGQPNAQQPGSKPDTTKRGATKTGSTEQSESTVKQGKTSKIAQTGFASEPLLVATALTVIGAGAGILVTRRRSHQ